MSKNRIRKQTNCL